ncbi:MAG: hypothetical protein F6K17_28125 [Okeania sp. SIO3C4]|nr:hypothetical protein [Okeania sp. SIO3C4]
MLNSVYDINLNDLGVRSQESGVRREERRRQDLPMLRLEDAICRGK